MGGLQLTKKAAYTAARNLIFMSSRVPLGLNKKLKTSLIKSAETILRTRSIPEALKLYPDPLKPTFDVFIKMAASDFDSEDLFLMKKMSEIYLKGPIFRHMTDSAKDDCQVKKLIEGFAAEEQPGALIGDDLKSDTKKKLDDFVQTSDLVNMNLYLEHTPQGKIRDKVDTISHLGGALGSYLASKSLLKKLDLFQNKEKDSRFRKFINFLGRHGVGMGAAFGGGYLLPKVTDPIVGMFQDKDFNKDYKELLRNKKTLEKTKAGKSFIDRLNNELSHLELVEKAKYKEREKRGSYSRDASDRITSDLRYMLKDPDNGLESLSYRDTDKVLNFLKDVRKINKIKKKDPRFSIYSSAKIHDIVGPAARLAIPGAIIGSLTPIPGGTLLGAGAGGLAGALIGSKLAPYSENYASGSEGFGGILARDKELKSLMKKHPKLRRLAKLLKARDDVEYELDQEKIKEDKVNAKDLIKGVISDDE